MIPGSGSWQWENVLSPGRLIVHNERLLAPLVHLSRFPTMPIEFLCPQCNQLLQTPDDSAGLHAICPQCNLTMVIPDPRPGGGAPVAPPPVPSAALPNPPVPSASASAAAPGGVASPGQEQPPFPNFVEYTPSPPSSLPVYESPPPATSAPSGLTNEPAGNSSLAAGGSSISSAARRSGPIPMPPGSSSALRRASEAAGSRGPQPASPSPTTTGSAVIPFRVNAAMAAGWDVMKANFNAFFIAALVFGIAMVVSLPTVVGFLVVAPMLAAGMGALAVQAARGAKPNVSVMLDGFQDFGSVFGRMFLWSLLMTACQLPFLLLTWMLSWTGLPIATTLGSLLLLGGCIVASSRLGWVPFAILEQPQLSFGQLLTHSLDISRGKTVELVKLSAMTYCAMAATIWALCVGVVLVGIPIAMGIGGATYVRLVRDAT